MNNNRTNVYASKLEYSCNIFLLYLYTNHDKNRFKILIPLFFICSSEVSFLYTLCDICIIV